MLFSYRFDLPSGRINDVGPLFSDVQCEGGSRIFEVTTIASHGDDFDNVSRVSVNPRAEITHPCVGADGFDNGLGAGPGPFGFLDDVFESSARLRFRCFEEIQGTRMTVS